MTFARALPVAPPPGRARTRRRELAAVLQAAAVSSGRLVTIYATPPEQISAPAVVLSAGRPYRAPADFGYGEVMALRVVCTVPRTAGTMGLDELDELLDWARDTLRLEPGVSWREIDAVGVTIYSGGGEQLSGVATFSVDL